MIAKIDGDTTIYVSPMHGHTYNEYIGEDNLGGPLGYFIARERFNQFEILAKAANLDAAREIFSMLTMDLRVAS